MQSDVVARASTGFAACLGDTAPRQSTVGSAASSFRFSVQVSSQLGTVSVVNKSDGRFGCNFIQIQLQLHSDGAH